MSHLVSIYLKLEKILIFTLTNLAVVSDLDANALTSIFSCRDGNVTLWADDKRKTIWFTRQSNT